MTTEQKQAPAAPTGRHEPLTRERIQENLRKGEEARKELERDIAILRGHGPGAPAKGVVRWR